MFQKCNVLNNRNTIKPTVKLFALILVFSSYNVQAQIIDFTFSALFTMVGVDGSFFENTSATSNSFDGNRTVMNGTMEYDTSNGAGALTVEPFAFGGAPTVWTGFEMQDIGNNLRLANAGFDWNGNFITTSLVWDATGLVNAVNAGLSNGSLVNGSMGGAIGATGNTVISAGPLGNITYPLGQSPLATTTYNTTPVLFNGVPISAQLPIINDTVVDMTNGDIGIGGSPMLLGPFSDLNINIDFNTLEVTNISQVPVPAAIWLFGSGLLGLVSVSRYKQSDRRDS